MSDRGFVRLLSFLIIGGGIFLIIASILVYGVFGCEW